MIEECLESPEKGVHSHGFLSTLRGLQVAVLITGDNAWNVKVERYRQTIIERHYEMPDGGIPEGFPPGQRNEGCSIADWIMVNLNAGLITGDETAYTGMFQILEKISLHFFQLRRSELCSGGNKECKEVSETCLC